jgi:uncharacterized protein
MLVRRLQPWHANLGKRLVKSPKVMVCDSGLVHALLNITDMQALLAHPVVGTSYEAYVIENLIRASPEGTQAFFYRTSAGAEIDLLLQLPGGALWAIEIKRSLQPKLERGFHLACEDILPARKFVLYPGEHAYAISTEVQVLPLHEMMALLHEPRSYYF